MIDAATPAGRHGADSGARTEKRELSVTGMTCPHCESVVAAALRSVPGVVAAEADRVSGGAVVRAAPGVSDAALVAAVEAAGYGAKPGAPGRRPALPVFFAALAAILAAGWALRRVLGVGLASLIPAVDGSATLAALFLAGLLTSLHCAGMCGALLVAATASPLSVSGRRWLPPALYNLARIAGYSAVGAAAGSIGRILPAGPAFRGGVQVVAGAAMLLLALNLLGVVRLPRIPRGFCKSPSLPPRSAGAGRAAALGLATALMPCGPLQAMQLWALGSGSAARGALGMACFGLGTAPLLFVFGAAAAVFARRRAILASVAAAIMAVLALGMVARGLRAWGFAALPPPPAEDGAWLRPATENGIDTVRFDLEWDRFPDIAVAAGRPVRLVVNADPEKITGCNNEIYSSALGFRLHVHPGENIVEFTPAKPGTFVYSCWMDMISARIKAE